MIHSIKERSNVSWFVLNNVLIVRNDNETIEFVFAHFNPRLTALAKMSLSRAQNIFMPKNINSITIIITLEGIEKIKTEKNDNRTVWTITRAFTSWMAFIFPSMKMHNSWLEITKSCHSTLKNYRRHERKVRQSLFVSVEINSTIAKVTVWHNWLNRVRLAWSRKTYIHFATSHGATTRGIYIRSFFWKKRTTKNVRASTFLWGWAILYVGCQALFVFMLCNCANLLCTNPALVSIIVDALTQCSV